MKKQKWYVLNKKADFNYLAQKFNIDQVTARIIRNKDIVSEKDIDKFLNGNLNDLYDPFLLKGISEAVPLIKSKIDNKKTIRIIGDYDIDGVMSTYILTEGIKAAGGIVDFAIPHRITDGYGLNIRLIEDAYSDGIDTIITCDNGIAATAEIERAKELGITVIVTDHHEVPYIDTLNESEGLSTDVTSVRKYILPPADVVIDPKREDETYPFTQICGAVVAYKLICALWQKYYSHLDATESFIEMAAFATIGDVMELVDENRILVRYGLEALENTKNTGLRALLAATELKGSISPYHVGFILGPCVNATGRLDTAGRAIDLLLCEDFEQAMNIANTLVELNNGRKDMTNKGVEEAVRIIEENGFDDTNDVLVVYMPEVHESLAGIIAGKIKERYYKPTFVLTKSENGIKGSGRSIENYDMYSELTRVNYLFTKYGGHRMAAGLSLEEKNLDLFRNEINNNSTLTEEDFTERIHIDMAMPFAYVSKKLIKELDRLGPFGNGNPKPIFARKNLEVINYRLFGKTNNVGKYTIKEENGSIFQLTFFGEQQRLIDRINTGELLSVCYYPDLNVYNGKEEIQFIIKDYQ